MLLFINVEIKMFVSLFAAIDPRMTRSSLFGENCSFLFMDVTCFCSFWGFFISSSFKVKLLQKAMRRCSSLKLLALLWQVKPKPCDWNNASVLQTLHLRAKYHWKVFQMLIIEFYWNCFDLEGQTKCVSTQSEFKISHFYTILIWLIDNT